MADLAITAAQIAIVNIDDCAKFKGVVAETVTAGQPVFLDSNGKYQLADANAAGEQQLRGLTLEAGVDGQTISILREGLVYGFTLTSQSYDDPIFLSDTVGVLADAAGTLSVSAGIVSQHTKDVATIEKVLYFRARWGADYA